MLSLRGVQQASSRLQISIVIVKKALNPFLSFLSLIWILAELASSAPSNTCTLKFSRDAGITVRAIKQILCPHLPGDELVFYPKGENCRISNFSKCDCKKYLQKGKVYEQEHPMSFSLVVSRSKEIKNPSWCWPFISVIHYQAQLVISQSQLLEIHASVKRSDSEKPGGLAN